jgi:hypothetical protein
MSGTPPRSRGLAGGARRTSLNLCGHSKPVHWKNPCCVPKCLTFFLLLSRRLNEDDQLFSRYSRPSVDVLSSARNLGRVRDLVAGGQGRGVDVSDQMSQNRPSKRGGVGPMWPVMLSLSSCRIKRRAAALQIHIQDAPVGLAMLNFPPTFPSQQPGVSATKAGWAPLCRIAIQVPKRRAAVSAPQGPKIATTHHSSRYIVTDMRIREWWPGQLPRLPSRRIRYLVVLTFDKSS